jgi:hypothetical protein
MLVIQLIPAEVLAELRRQSEEIVGGAKRAGKIAAVVIWIMATALPPLVDRPDGESPLTDKAGAFSL